MNITFIFGNGFDLQIGLKTSYRDFLETYKIIDEKTDSDNIIAFKKEIAVNSDRWSDAETEFGKHLGKYSDDTFALFVERKRNFAEAMRQYLLLQQQLCDYSETEKINVGFSDFIFHSYNDVMNRKGRMLAPPNNQGIVYGFITFNYTDVINRILDCFPPRSKSVMRRGVYDDFFGKVIPVHGTLETAPMFGVNDASQMDSSGGVTVTPEVEYNLIKPVLNQASGYNYDAPAKKMIDQSSIIYIYGLSFGITDKLWWNLLAEWLIRDPNHKIVWFKKDDRDINLHIAEEELSAESEYRRELLSHLGFDTGSEDYKKVLDRVFIIHNTQRLEMGKILLKK